MKEIIGGPSPPIKYWGGDHVPPSPTDWHLWGQEGWLSSTERASVSAISLRHILASPVLARPWDNHGKCHMDEKRIQCLSKALQHVPIYLQPFTSYSEILVGNCNFFLPLAFNDPVRVFPLEVREKFVLRKLESCGYQAVKTVWRYVKPFRHHISVWRSWRTDEQTDSLYQ